MPQAQHLYIVTGSSRGLGAALAAQLLGDFSHRVLGIARRRNDTLEGHGALEQWPLDLAQPLEAAQRLEDWLAAQDGATFASASLINNAAALTRIGALDAVAPDELSRALRVGLEAPMLLTAAFLRATAAWGAARRVLNISSGLGRRAMAGQASYCAVKAGLDHFSRALALDEALKTHGAKVVSLAPGVIDTDMQVQLRAGDPAAFPDHDMFVQLKTGGRLSTPEDCARQVLAYLARPDFGSKPVADVREA